MADRTAKPEPGRWFRDRRNQLELTLDEMAARCRVTRNTVGNWERGIAYPTPTTAEELLEAYSTDLPTLAVQTFLLAMHVAARRAAA